jgi:hypothetical protein
MDRSVDAARFTRQTLTWFEEGELLAASERATAAELTAQRGRAGFAVGVLIALALLGCAAVLAARHFGLVAFELPWGLTFPWE